MDDGRLQSVSLPKECVIPSNHPNQRLRQGGLAHIQSFRNNREDSANRVVWLAEEDYAADCADMADLESADAISVIIVNFNCGDLLVECVRSVFGSKVPVHVVVLDNCSTDSSVAILTATFGSNPKLTIVKNSRNFGFARACNLGLARAKGRYALFLNPDCLVNAKTLQRMLAVMDSHPRAAMAGCLIRNPDGSEQRGCRRQIPTPWASFVYVSRLYRLFGFNKLFKSFNMTGSLIPEKPIEVEAISGAFMFLRTDAIEEVGPLDEGYFLHCEDLDWCMRFQRAGYNILFVPGTEIIHYKGASTVHCRFRVEWHKHRSMIRFYKKHLRQRYPPALTWLITSSVWLRFGLRSVVLALGVKQK